MKAAVLPITPAEAIGRMMEENGLEAVFMANRPALLRFVNARGGRDEAEDLLQELWVKIATVPTGPVASPLSYLYRMADNLLLDRRRSARRRQHREEAWGEEAAGMARPGDTPTIERALIARERLDVIEAALLQHGERTVTIFRKHRLEGVKQRHIAADMGLSLSLVEKELQKAYRAVIDARRKLDAGFDAERRPDPIGGQHAGH